MHCGGRTGRFGHVLEGPSKDSGGSIIQELHVYYRLGDFSGPIFISETELQFYYPPLSAIEEKALALLPEEAVTIAVV